MPPKKLSKKERARQEAEQAEQLRLEMEKERLRKLEEEKQEHLRAREEAHKRQKQEYHENKLRRVQLKESTEFFMAAKKIIRQINLGKKTQLEWEQFMRCDGLPNPEKPGDLRKYFHMWQTEIGRLNKRDRNWLLLTNERTILTQNRLVENLTQAHLKVLQPELGDQYVGRINEVLGILDNIQETIDAENMPRDIKRDLERLKYEFRQTLAAYIDEFSHKILCNIDRDMVLEALMVATHKYDSPVFRSQLWTLRDVPEPHVNQKDKVKEESRRTQIEFKSLDMSILLPPSVKCFKSAFRGLWLNFDHCSDACSSSYAPYQQKHIVNLETQAHREWAKRKEILRATLQEAAAMADLVVPFEGAELAPPSKVPDVDKLHTDFDEEHLMWERQQKGPNALHLDETDINLRSHRIVGGVYRIDYIEQPLQDIRLNADSFLRTLIHPNELTLKTFHQVYTPPPPPQPGVRRLPEEIEAEIKTMEENLDKLALITIQLPDTVFWFEPPIVCRWETLDDVNINDNPDAAATAALPAMLSSTRQPTARTVAGTAVTWKSKSRVIDDFDLLNLPRDLDVAGLMAEFVLPHLPDGYSIRIPNVNTTTATATMFTATNATAAAVDTPTIVPSTDRNTKKPATNFLMAADHEVDKEIESSLAERDPSDSGGGVGGGNVGSNVGNDDDADDDDNGDSGSGGRSSTSSSKSGRSNASSVKVHNSKGYKDDNEDDVIPTSLQQYPKVSATAKELFSQSSSPRLLFPKVPKRPQLTIMPHGKHLSHGLCSAHVLDDKLSALDGDDTMLRAPVYWFSEFLKDLEDLAVSLNPRIVAQRISAINSILSSPTSVCAQGAASPKSKIRDGSAGISITRENELAAFDSVNGSVLKRESNDVGDKDQLLSSSSLLVPLQQVSLDDIDAADEDDDDDFDVANDENYAGSNEHNFHFINGNGEHNDKAIATENDFTAEEHRFGRGKWSTREVHDAKFNEDKLIIQFRTGRLGAFALASNRYSNLPFQTWEIKPDFKCPGTVNFSLTASVISIDLSITSAGVRLNGVQGCSLTPVEKLVGTMMPLNELKRRMRLVSVEVFPDDDAFCYTEGTCEKNNVMENHLYECMGVLSMTHNFSWSRWNMVSGCRTAVLLMRELQEHKKAPPQSTLYVTPLKACVVDCTEVSASFNTNGVPGMEYYADLYHLGMAHSLPESRTRQEAMDPLLRNNIVQVLKSTRPLSYC